MCGSGAVACAVRFRRRLRWTEQRWAAELDRVDGSGLCVGPIEGAVELLLGAGLTGVHGGLRP